jgi:predicted aspartyl protease
MRISATGHFLALGLLLAHPSVGKSDLEFRYTKIIFSSDDHLVTPVSVNHTPVTWWAVDTGAPRSIIDTELAKRLELQAVEQLKASQYDADKGSTFPIVEPDDLQIGMFHAGRVACVERSIKNIRSLRTTVWNGKFEKTGLIGLDLLARYGAIINIRAGKIFFSPTGNLGMSRQGYEQIGFTYVPLAFTGGRLVVNGTLSREKCAFLIDTGAPFTVLDESVRRQANIPFNKAGTLMLPFIRGAVFRVNSGTAGDFKIGDYDAKGATLCFAPFSPRPFAGIIGVDFLYYRSALIDIGGRALYLKPSTSGR